MGRPHQSPKAEAATSLQFEAAGYAALAHGQAQPRILDDDWRGEAEVRLELIPKPGIYIYALFKTEAASGPLMHAASDPRAVSDFSIDGKHIDGFATEARFISTEPDKLLVKWCPTHDPLSAVGDNSTQIHQLNAHLFDSRFPNLDLTTGPWTLALRRCTPRSTGHKPDDSQPLPEATHTLQLRMAKDQPFSGEQATDILDAVAHFLTFVQGGRCWPVCPIGVDASGDTVWSLWSSPSYFEPNPPGWYGGDGQTPIADLFRTFMDKWSDEQWRKTLTEVVWWHESAARASRGIDIGIVLAQIAVELLAYRHCVDDRRSFSRRQFKPLSAADKYRHLLRSLHIPVAIPATARALLAARTTGWSDGPEAVTSIRNDLVHKGRELGLSVDAHYEAWSLAVHYLELTLLAMLDYKGDYRNRIDGTMEPVPWPH